MVDELVHKLQNTFPGVIVKGFERSTILTTLSRMYGKKVEHMGRKKK
jgi:hypothetical protein